MQKKAKAGIRKLNIFIWFTLGLIISLACMGMYLSHSVNPDRFYDVGEVYNYSQDVIRQNGAGWQYHSNTKRMEFTEAVSEKSFQFGDGREDVRWKYLCLKLAELEEELPVTISYYNNTELVKQADLELKNGWNVLKLPREEITQFSVIGSAPGTMFRLLNVQLREQKPVFDMGMAVLLTVLFFGIYTILCVILWKYLKRHPVTISMYGVIEGFQKLYLAIGRVLQSLPRISDAGLRGVLRSGCLMLFFFITNWSIVKPESVLGGYMGRVVPMVLLLVIEIWLLLPEKELRLLNWRQPLVYAWFLLSIWMCVSDFIYPKMYSYLGYIFLLVFGMLFFVWGNREDDCFVTDIIRAVKWYAIVNLAYCLLCRPYSYNGYRYPGSFTNPNTYSMYLVIVSVAFYCEIEELLKARRQSGWIWFDVQMLAINALLIYRTQSRTGLLSFVVLSLVFLLRFRVWRKEYFDRKSFKKMLLILLSAVVILPVFGWVSQNLPNILHTAVRYQEDTSLSGMETGSLFTMQVHAAELKDSILNSRFVRMLASGSLESFTTGRTQIYRMYLSCMNLAGHSNLPYIFGGHYFGHNMVLDISYRYGVVAVIPYLLLIICGIKNAFRYAGQNRRYGMLFLGAFSVIVTIGMIECIEVPTKVIPWFLFYFLIGGLFTVDNGKGREPVCEKNL